MRSLFGCFVTRTVLTLALFSAPGCGSGYTESLAEADQSIISTHKEIIQLKRRPDYFSGELRRQYLIRQASEIMRKNAPEPSRSFYRTPEEKNMSFSIGDTRDGYLINGQPLPAPSLLLRQLPVQYTLLPFLPMQRLHCPTVQKDFGRSCPH